ncbi:diguanylate cyclase [Chitinispirillales bacterium ANBcel5]|uniref:sensor domain-containing diguanylate cyclase n=1 Tax=Cellulosispirillum alkaliphilum TaxID=3039283 RepID=UPI002A5025C7|nr:diguanylate cyclase [Chitinispirillales bacterium ANBcel5]
MTLSLIKNIPPILFVFLVILTPASIGTNILLSMELLTVTLCLTIFLLGWNTRAYLKESFLLALGFSALLSGTLTLFSITRSLTSDPHSLSGVFQVAARCFQNSIFLTALLYTQKKASIKRMVPTLILIPAFYTLSLSTALIYFVEINTLLSRFVTNMPFLIMLPLSFIVVLYAKALFDRKVFLNLLAAHLFFFLSEVTLTLSPALPTTVRLLVFSSRLAGFFLIFKITLFIVFQKSFTMLVKNLTRSKEAERTARKRAERRAAELDALRANLTDMLAEHNSKNLLKAILTRAISLLDGTGGELGLLDKKDDTIRIEVAFNTGDNRSGKQIEIGSDVLGYVGKSRKPLVLHGHGVGSGRLPQYPFTQWSGLVAVPLIAAGKLVGVISVTENNAIREFSDADVELMQMFAQQAAMAIRTIQLLEKARHQAETDSLTGLYNHRHFFDKAKQEVKRAVRYDHNLSAIMFDIDHFKLVNDTFGHSAGDVVIQSIAEICRNLFRSLDIIGRYGGEEFIILLPETEPQRAREVAERLRQTVVSTPFCIHNNRITVSISLGVSFLNKSSPSLNELIFHADEALYSAKNSGRNRTCIWHNELRTPLKTSRVYRASTPKHIPVKPKGDKPFKGSITKNYPSKDHTSSL